MRVLADTSALLALNRQRDQYHARAIAFARRHKAIGGRYIGTTLILSEVHSHLLYARGAAHARAALLRLLGDPAHEWVSVDTDLLADGITNWLARFADQSFSLVDAVSFEVMRREKISHAFAFDRHFEVAGYELLG
ncbi:MAG: type II toxin-antitoxin system VapC family toxin [Gemmatimonadota bacterium]